MRHSGQYIISHRQVLWRTLKNDMKATYAGSLFGYGWTLLTPLLMLILYALVYLVIFRVRVEGMTSIDYVTFVFSGLVPFLMTSRALSSGISAIISNKDVLSNVVFPIDLTPVMSVLQEQTTMVVGFTMILLISIATGSLGWTIVFLPLIWFLHLLWLIGIVWVLSLLNLIIRDINSIIALVIMMMMVASPIAYTPEMVPAQLKIIIYLNPFAYFVIFYQYIVMGSIPPWYIIVITIVQALGLFIFGGLYFFRIKKALVDFI